MFGGAFYLSRVIDSIFCGGHVLNKNIYLKYLTDVERCLFLVAGLTVFYAAYIAIYYSGQELLEQYSFRQTQTALASYWFGKNGFGVAYETPVGGRPGQFHSNSQSINIWFQLFLIF